MTNVVYLDVVVAGNIIMNYAILWITAKFARLNPRRWRLLLGAALGSIYALTVFIPQWQWMLLWTCKLAISIVLVLSAFAPLTWRRFLIVLGYFYVASMSMGGIVMGTIYFIHSQGNNTHLLDFLELVQQYFWAGIITALLLTWVIGRWGTMVFNKRVFQKSIRTAVTIEMFNGEVKVNALLDTGNSLTDPVTGMPVMIVEHSVIKKVLPAGINNLYESADNINYSKLQQVLTDDQLNACITIIPYQSLGNSNGMLLGIKPDKVTIHSNQSIVKEDLWIAIHNGIMASDDGYRALLHPDLLNAA
ncbi:MAG: sigma-E processing peptidase SpoIIGA [Firmicutes bacterium]|nr:sigma-E processing peptidase SpoIIGA [Bacillota bacterium]